MDKAMIPIKTDTLLMYDNGEQQHKKFKIIKRKKISEDTYEITITTNGNTDKR